MTDKEQEHLEDLPDTSIWKLRLYVAGQTPKSLAAFANLKKNLRRTPGREIFDRGD
jgi:circadian clock protein KaiB